MVALLRTDNIYASFVERISAENEDGGAIVDGRGREFGWRIEDWDFFC